MANTLVGDTKTLGLVEIACRARVLGVMTSKRRKNGNKRRKVKEPHGSSRRVPHSTPESTHTPSSVGKKVWELVTLSRDQRHRQVVQHSPAARNYWPAIYFSVTDIC